VDHRRSEDRVRYPALLTGSIAVRRPPPIGNGHELLAALADDGTLDHALMPLARFRHACSLIRVSAVRPFQRARIAALIRGQSIDGSSSSAA
jgi:hypothetical protein